MGRLFTVGQVVKSCGVSRSTILRLEERGILKPAFCSPENGYRYYDNYNVTLILQVKMLLSMGISYNHIKNYYNTGGGSLPDIIKELSEKMALINSSLEKMSVRLNKSEGMKVSIVRLPDYICYTREVLAQNPCEMCMKMQEHFNEAVEKGYTPLASAPLFLIVKRRDFLLKECSHKEYSYVCCIPLEPKNAPKEAIKISGCKALSVIYYGSYEKSEAAFTELGNKAKEMRLKSIDFPRVLGIVAPYTGREIKPDSFVTQLALPIGD